MKQTNGADLAARPGGLPAARTRTGLAHLFSRHARYLVKYRALLLMMLPALAVVAVNSYLPMFGIIVAFKSINYSDGIFFSPWIGLDNFAFLFQSSDLWVAVRNTVLYNLFFIFGGLVLSVAVAIGLNELRVRFLSKVYQTLIILPSFLSMVVISYLVYAFLNPEYGIVNQDVLKPLGMEPVNWYFEPRYWPYILSLVRFWATVGMGSIIYLATLIGIDPEYYEAALIDGAGKWAQIRYITLPMLKNVMIIIVLLSLGGIFRGDFGLFYQVTLNSGALVPTTDIIDTYVYRALITLQDIGMSSAASFCQSVVGFIFVFCANLAVRKISKENALF